MTDFRMPSLGADMDDGKLVEWLKKPGDTLKRGDIMAVVETQKGAIEIEVFATACWNRPSRSSAKHCLWAPCWQPSAHREKRWKSRTDNRNAVPAAVVEPLACLVRGSASPPNERHARGPRRWPRSPASISQAVTPGADGIIGLREIGQMPERPENAQEASISTRCARPSPRPWPAASARSRIITSAPPST